MVTLITKDKSVVEKLAKALNKSEGVYLERDYNAIASEYLTEERAKEQIELFQKEVNKKYPDFSFRNKKLLEIGAGVGAFLITLRKKYEIEAYGIEPSEEEFSPFNEISMTLLSEHSMPKNIIVKGYAEALPFEDETFDLVYSTNVLEHVQDPKKVLSESLRVLRRGGFLQFVVPNYFSLWEGHYGILWPCITNKFLGKLYLKLIGKKIDYIDTLQMISPFYLKKSLQELSYQVEIIEWGKDVFKTRLETGNYSDWAALKNVRWMVQLIKWLKLSSFLAGLLNLFQMYTPIVLTIKKS